MLRLIFSQSQHKIRSITVLTQLIFFFFQLKTNFLTVSIHQSKAVNSGVKDLTLVALAGHDLNGSFSNDELNERKRNPRLTIMLQAEIRSRRRPI